MAEPAVAADPEGAAGERTGQSLVHFLVVDDHPLFREALTSTLARAFPDSHLHEAEGVEAALAVLEAHSQIDLILLDLSMQGVTSFEGLIGIRVRFPRVPVLVVSGHEDPQVVRDVIQHGAAGFVPKSLCKATLIEAINDVLGGALFFPPSFAEAASVAPSRKVPLPERIARLTPQQIRVLGMIRQGLLNKQIAHELQVGSSTVKAHVSEILRKLEVSSRTQIVIATADLDRGLKAYGS